MKPTTATTLDAIRDQHKGARVMDTPEINDYSAEEVRKMRAADAKTLELSEATRRELATMSNEQDAKIAELEGVVEKLRDGVASLLLDAGSLGIETGEEHQCASCGEGISVASGMEWEDGDWCYSCWQTFAMKAVSTLSALLSSTNPEQKT